MPLTWVWIIKQAQNRLLIYAWSVWLFLCRSKSYIGISKLAKGNNSFSIPQRWKVFPAQICPLHSGKAVLQTWWAFPESKELRKGKKNDLGNWTETLSRFQTDLMVNARPQQAREIWSRSFISTVRSLHFSENEALQTRRHHENHCPRFPKSTTRKWPMIVTFSKFAGVVWKENVWCAFRVKNTDGA